MASFRRSLPLLAALVLAGCWQPKTKKAATAGAHPQTLDEISASLTKMEAEVEKSRRRLVPEAAEALHKDLAAFRQSGSSKDKFRIANRLLMPLNFLDPAIKLSAEETRIATEVMRYLQNLSSLERTFEAGLKSDEIHFITQDNPEAPSRLTGVFSQNVTPGACTVDEYRRLRDKVGLKTLSDQGTLMMLAIHTREARFQTAYRRRIRQLIAGNRKYARFKGLLETVYDEDAVAAGNAAVRRRFPAPSDEERRSDTEQELIAKGIPRADLGRRLSQLAALAPHCLGELNLDFPKLLKIDVTQARGRYFLDQLRQKVGHEPIDGESLVALAGDPLYGTTHDAWGNNYALDKSESGYRFYSLGPDGEKSGDDIVIGNIP